MAPTLEQLEQWASGRGLMLRVQSGRPLGALHAIRAGVATQHPDGRLLLLGELKGWAWPTADGLHLDTLQVAGRQASARHQGVGPLLAAAAFAWALEVTPCRRARILAIHDDDRQHRRLVRYFQGLGFTAGRPVGAAPADLPLRLIWGGAGLLMAADCAVVLARCWRRLQALELPTA